MGMESIGSPKKPKDPEAHLERMLLEFPEEILTRIEDRIQGKPLDEQISIVEDALKRRREILKRPRYTSERLRMIERVPDSVFDRFSQTEHQVEVGRGDNGRVFEYSTPEEGAEQVVVFKMLIRPPAEFQNDLLEEGAYQADVSQFAREHAHLQIGVSELYYVAASSKGYVLAMEKLPGKSVKVICTDNDPIPEHVDLDLIEARLEAFVQELNGSGFYHRDISEGNIMIDLDRTDPNAPLAYLIDFGLCTKATTEEEAYRTVDGRRDYGMIRKVIDRLRERRNIRQGV